MFTNAQLSRKDGPRNQATESGALDLLASVYHSFASTDTTCSGILNVPTDISVLEGLLFDVKDRWD